MRKKITVKDLKSFKGKTKRVCILIKNEEEALAADKVGFEMLATGLAGKYKNDDEFFAHMNRQVTTFMLLGGVGGIKGRPTPEQMLLALLVTGRY